MLSARGICVLRASKNIISQCSLCNLCSVCSVTRLGVERGRMPDPPPPRPFPNFFPSNISFPPQTRTHTLGWTHNIYGFAMLGRRRPVRTTRDKRPESIYTGDDVESGDASGRETRKSRPNGDKRRAATAGTRAPVQLLTDLPAQTNQAMKSFKFIEQCTYQHGKLGNAGSGRRTTMFIRCDCDKEVVNGVNVACDGNCINKITQIECVGKTPCGRGCRNRRFQRKEWADVDVVWMHNKGYGVRARQDIDPDGFVFEYVGEVIDNNEFTRRTNLYSNNRLKHFYFMMLQNREFIDATQNGSLARFVNHSCRPNCYIEKWIVDGKLRMGLFAKRTIKSNEEITFDYNVDRYGAMPQTCYCGESNCRGVLGGRKQTMVAGRLPAPTFPAAASKQSTAVENLPTPTFPNLPTFPRLEQLQPIKPLEKPSKPVHEPEPVLEHKPEPEHNPEPEHKSESKLRDISPEIIEISDDEVVADKSEPVLEVSPESQPAPPHSPKPQEQVNIEPAPMYVNVLDLSEKQLQGWKVMLNQMATTAKRGTMLNEEELLGDSSSELPVNRLDEPSVGKVIAALMQQVGQHWLVGVLVKRIHLTLDENVNYQCMRLHGYQVFSNIINEYGLEDDDLTDRVLQVMKRWPRQSKNKISASTIETSVSSLRNTTNNKQIREKCESLQNEWNCLRQKYRIPKLSNAKLKPPPSGGGSSSNCVQKMVGNGTGTGTETETENGTGTGTGTGAAADFYHLKLKNSHAVGNDDVEVIEILSDSSDNNDTPLQPPSNSDNTDSNTDTDTAEMGSKGKGSKRSKPRLPLGWKSHTARGGLTYYYNTELGLRQWERPDQSKIDSMEKNDDDGKNKRDRQKRDDEPANKRQKTKQQHNQSNEEEEEVVVVEASPSAEKAQHIQEIINNTTKPPSPVVPESSSATSNKPSIASEKDDERQAKLKQAFAKYIANVVARYEKTFGRDNCKQFSKELTSILVKKELSRHSTSGGHGSEPTELSEEKRKKIKAFVIDYMDKAVTRYHDKKGKSKQSTPKGVEPVDQPKEQKEDVASISTSTFTPTPTPTPATTMNKWDSEKAEIDFDD